MCGKPAISKCVPFNPLHSAEKIRLISDILKSGTDVRLRVTGASMKPFLQTGSIVTLSRTPVNRLRLGDLILCRCEGNAMLLHRLIRFMREKDRSFLITKGDALDTPDQPIDKADYMARVTRVATGEGVVEASYSMDSVLSQATNYIRAVYHRSRFGVISKYIQYKNR